MAIRIQPLSDALCRSAKPGPDGKPLKLFDGGGLFLMVSPTGARLWRLKYRFAGKEKLLSLGTYPELTLQRAREERQRAKSLLSQGVDPSVQKKEIRLQAEIKAANTLEAVVREWLALKSGEWSQTNAEKVEGRLRNYVLPWLGSLPLDAITVPAVLETLKRAGRTTADGPRRIRHYLSSVFAYAIQTGRATSNPAAQLVGAIARPISRRHPSIKDSDLFGRLLLDLENYQGTLPAWTALQLAPMLFCRPGELRGMTWAELNLERAEWVLPPARQKLRQRTKQEGQVDDWICPLPRQAVALIEALRPLTGNRVHVFPNERTPTRAMSDGTVNAALRRLGYTKEQITGHGFRHTASTMLNEMREKGHRLWSSDAVEEALAHRDPTVRGIYNSAKYLPERIEMMQYWADLLDQLKDKARNSGPTPVR